MSNKPKPTNLRVLEGNRGHRPIPNNPEPQKAFKDPPEGLDELAREHWLEVGQELYNLGLLTVLNLRAFEMMCKCYSQWKQALDRVSEISYLKEYRMWCVEFGMTPSALSKIHVEKKPKERSKMAEILGG